MMLRAIWYDRLPSDWTRCARLYDPPEGGWRLVLNEAEESLQLDTYCGTEEAALRLFDEFKWGELTIRAFIESLAEERWDDVKDSVPNDGYARDRERADVQAYRDELLDKCRRGETI